VADFKNPVTIVGLDVGGTDTDADLVKFDGKLKMLSHYMRADSFAHDEPDNIIQGFAKIISLLKSKGEEAGEKVVACGIGMPGPFNYHDGISEMNGKNDKFERTHGFNFKEPLEKETGLPIYFLNNSDAYGLGVYTQLYSDAKRLMAVTLGAGVGLCAMIDGEFRRNKLPPSELERIPENGIWDTPLYDKNVEYFVSARGIQRSYSESSGKTLDFESIAKQAKEGNSFAQNALGDFGRNLGLGLADFINKFSPTRIVFGGEISVFYDLFEMSFKNAIEGKVDPNIPITVEVAEKYAIYGAAKYASSKL
jgi:glucokinase